ncbi:MAG: amidohydrolase family protein [Thermomonas sp.]
MSTTLIINARLVNEGHELDGELRFKDGRIDQIGNGLAARDGEAVIDAAGRRLLPGMIDDQIHFREPGMEYKADMAIESAAAVAGGLTSFMDMPNTNPPTLNRDALEEKARPYASAPSGLPLVQFALNAALELVHEGKLTTAQVVQKFAHAPAQLFDVSQRGFLREGYAADLVLVDDTPSTVQRSDVLSKCGWSPFEGTTFHTRVAATWVNGHLAWDGAALLGAPIGQRLQFDR